MAAADDASRRVRLLDGLWESWRTTTSNKPVVLLRSFCDGRPKGEPSKS